MISWSHTIIHPDDQFEIEEWIITMCNLEYENYQSNNTILTRKIIEDHLENIIKQLQNGKDQYAIEFLMLGGMLMETGAKIPDQVRYRIVESINFEMEKKNNYTEQIREKFFTDYKDKILNYQNGIPQYIVNLKLKNDSEIENAIIGLEDFHKNISESNFQKIQYINLDGSNLEIIPKEIEYFHQLKVLSLENNKMNTISDSIFKLGNLEILYLNGNAISSLLDNVSQLSNLQILYLQYNKLNSISEAIGSLRSLKQIYLQNNKLSSVPDSLGNLGNLSLINLENNPLENIPDNLIPDTDYDGLYRSKAQFEKIIKKRK